MVRDVHETEADLLVWFQGRRVVGSNTQEDRERGGGHAFIFGPSLNLPALERAKTGQVAIFKDVWVGAGYQALSGLDERPS